SAMIPIPKYGEYTILLHPDLYGDWLDMGIEEIIALQKSPFGFSLDLAAPAETTVEVPDEFVLPPEWGGWWTEDMGLAALFIPGYIIGNGPIEEWVEAYEWDAIADPSQINLAVLEGARLPLPPGAKITVTLNLTLSDTHEARDVAGAENSYGVLSMGGTEGLGGLAGWLIPTNPVAMRMWQYVDFYYNYDNEGDARFAEQAVAHSATATTPTPSPTREGYTFMGWYTDEAGTVPFDFTTPITENVQLYARWADEVPVRFLYNDGRNSGITALNDDPLAYYTFYLTSVLRGETVGLPTLGAPTREGYTFVDWYVDRETTQRYDFDTPVTAYLQLFARWAVIPPTCNCTCEDCCDCGDNCTCEEPNDCCDCQVGGGGGGNGDNDDPPAPDMIKNPDRHLVSVGDLVNWTLQGFHNRSGEAVSGFTIVDVPGRGLNFEAGRLPAFTRGEGITYDILYTVYGSDEVFVHETGIDASVPFNFRLPQPGNRYYTSIALYFGDVPAYFGLGDQIIFTFLVVPGAPGNQLINRFWVRYDNVDREGDNNNSIVVPPGGGTPGQPGAPGDTPGGTPGTGMPAPAPGSPSLPWPVGPGSQGGLNNQRPTDYLYVAYDEEPTMVSVLPIPTSPIHHAYMIGFAEDGTIRPQANITRAETATIFFRLTGDAHRAGIWSQQNTFADVELSRWFNNPVSTMQNAGLFAGIPLGDTFAPNQAATRAEFAAMVVNYLGLGHYQVTGGHHFSDIDGHWASNAINVAYMQGWVNGFGDGTFRPDQLITRAEVAALVNRALGRLPETADDLLPGMQLWPDNMNQSAWYYLYIQEATNSNLHELKEDGVHKTWTQLVSPRNWRALERPYSSPWDISN
ncbi:MAG: S-layer homology domain-containing protein, partial [Defluviitaleaceae bacterium]|nr:S-layer homology domain-containing protein [Defluviitaleaceae bacterium]